MTSKVVLLILLALILVSGCIGGSTTEGGESEGEPLGESGIEDDGGYEAPGSTLVPPPLPE